jgi:broad specificity phosphatase PhoE
MTTYSAGWRRLVADAIANGARCADCGTDRNLEGDHELPVSKGGLSTRANLAIRCRRHNRAKGNRVTRYQLRVPWPATAHHEPPAPGPRSFPEWQAGWLAGRASTRQREGESTMNISTSVRQAITGKPQPWERPSFDMPITLSESELEDYLGEARGSSWYRVKRWGGAELAEGQRKDDQAALPDGPVVQTSDEVGRREWRTFAVHEAGTYLRLTTMPLRRPPKPAPAHRPVDLLGFASLADRKPELVIAPPSGPSMLAPPKRPGPYIRPPEPPARGAEAILDRLQRAGAEVRLSASGNHLVVMASDGRPRPGVVELVNLTERLLVGYLSGQPAACEVSAHKTSVPAVTAVLGGALACAMCVAATDEKAGAA